MARNYYVKKNRRSMNRKNRRRKNSARSLTSLAYRMGQIDRGRANPESRISEAYERGNTKPSKRVKKPLF